MQINTIKSIKALSILLIAFAAGVIVMNLEAHYGVLLKTPINLNLETLFKFINLFTIIISIVTAFRSFILLSEIPGTTVQDFLRSNSVVIFNGFVMFRLLYRMIVSLPNDYSGSVLVGIVILSGVLILYILGLIWKIDI